MSHSSDTSLVLSGILSELVADLTDCDNKETQDISACGPAVVGLILQAATRLLAWTDGQVIPEDVDIVQLSLKTLHTLAQEMINTIPFNIVPNHWLRLFTDVSLLQSIGDVIMGELHDKEEAFNSIRRLDMAIIVAGAIGRGRKEWVLRVIKAVQASLPPRDNNLSMAQERSFKKPRIDPSTSLYFAPHHVPILKESPSVEEYLDNHLEQPFILRGYLTGTDSSPSWPACHRWGDSDYILESLGQGRVVPVEVGKAYDDEGWSQKIIPLEEFLKRAGSRKDDHLDPPLYLAQYSLFDQFPQLEKDMSFPEYVWSSPPPTKDMPSYSCPKTDDGLIVNVWVGSGNNEIISPAHTDPYYNCYAQVLGRKRVWLAPPSSGPHMYAYGGGDGMADQYMTNTSKVPILRPIDEFTKLEKSYPDFFRHVWPDSLEAILEPGDIMIMPPGWWHAMRAEGEGPVWSVSMWY